MAEGTFCPKGTQIGFRKDPLSLLSEMTINKDIMLHERISEIAWTDRSKVYNIKYAYLSPDNFGLSTDDPVVEFFNAMSDAKKLNLPNFAPVTLEEAIYVGITCKRIAPFEVFLVGNQTDEGFFVPGFSYIGREIIVSARNFNKSERLKNLSMSWLVKILPPELS